VATGDRSNARERSKALAGEFPPAAKQAVFDVISLRRDIRSFRPDPVPDEVLLRILAAAHRAGSVGFMQPWDFILIRSHEKKTEAYELFRRANERAAGRFQGDRRRKYRALKLQGLLDAPLCVCITCDTTRGGPHVLGRDTIRETDVYSTCLAVQNLWLAARAEGVGVGWLSIVDNSKLSACLGLPTGVTPVAFLCVGYPVEFPDAPLLEATGWRGRVELVKLIHFDEWGGAGIGDSLKELLAAEPPGRDSAVRAIAGDAASLSFSALLEAVEPVDPEGEAATRVWGRLDALTKPRGSLGRLERLAADLACIQGREYPSAERKRIAVFAGDHGVCVEGISAYRQEATSRLCYNFVAGGGVVNALARQAGAELLLVDVGVAHDFEGASGLCHRKVALGTRNFVHEPAMKREQALQGMLAGAGVVAEGPECDLLALGEVGIGNTTSAAAVLALLTGAEATEVVGRGTGVGSAGLRRKIEVVRRAVERCGRGAERDPLRVLEEVGGFEIAALAGAILAAASRRVPVLLDGYITGVAALVAVELCPAASGYLIASHRSAEQGHALVLERLGLEPLLELDMRLGEGSGAALAIPMAESACAILREVRTFREAGIDEPIEPVGVDAGGPEDSSE
jgi:nicotinate-nucleotide--dimethylbenzimidazole phosphoribosyltransferase